MSFHRHNKIKDEKIIAQPVKRENEAVECNIETADNLERVTEKEAGEEESIEEKELKWKYAAFVVDRLFLFLSTIFFIFTFFPIILTMPNFYHAQ